jgi:hypothetical protein
MSKGSGTGGSGNVASTSGQSGSSTGKVKSPLLSRTGNSGKALQGLIAGKGGIAKHVLSHNSQKLILSKSKFKDLSKVEVALKSKNLSTVQVQVSHSYRNSVGGGGALGITVSNGAEDILAAKLAGAKQIKATIIQIGKRGKKTTWIGLIDL